MHSKIVKIIPTNWKFLKNTEEFLCHECNRYGLILFIILPTFYWKCVLWKTSSENYVELCCTRGQESACLITLLWCTFYKLSRKFLELVHLFYLLSIKEICIFYYVHYTPQNGYKIYKNVLLLLIVLYRVHEKALLCDHVHLPVIFSSANFSAT
jgi:hypothetical protein